MNVILLEKVGKLGAVGDTASVKAGYARNFLFPAGKAIPATKTNLDNFETRRAQLLAAHKLFGSIGTRDIAEAITAASGEELSKAEVRLPNGALRDVGEYEISIDLGYEVEEVITLAIVPA